MCAPGVSSKACGFESMPLGLPSMKRCEAGSTLILSIVLPLPGGFWVLPAPSERAATAARIATFMCAILLPAAAEGQSEEAEQAAGRGAAAAAATAADGHRAR